MSPTLNVTAKLKNVTVSLSALIFACILTWPPPSAAAGSTEDVKKEIGEAVEATKEYTKAEKEAFEARMQKNLEQIETNLRELKTQAATASQDAKASLGRKIDRLEERRQELGRDLGQLQKTSGRAWTKLRHGFVKALDEVRTAFNTAKQEFSDGKGEAGVAAPAEEKEPKPKSAAKTTGRPKSKKAAEQGTNSSDSGPAHKTEESDQENP